MTVHRRVLVPHKETCELLYRLLQAGFTASQVQSYLWPFSLCWTAVLLKSQKFHLKSIGHVILTCSCHTFSSWPCSCTCDTH